MSTCHSVITTSINNFSGDKPTKLRTGFLGDKPCLFIIHFAEKMRTMGISQAIWVHWFLGANLEFGSKSLNVLFTVSSKGIRDVHINAFSWVCHMHHRIPKMDNILIKATSDPRLF